MRILIALLILTASAYAATVTAASCTLAAMNTAISAAVTGDTIVIAAGARPCSVSWASRATIPSTKGITIDGGGNTTLTNWGFAIQQGATTTRITGFISNDAEVLTNQATWVADGTPVSAAFRIDHNTFQTPGEGTFITVAGNAPGLIDHNLIANGNGPSELIHNEGTGFGDTTGWTNTVLPGSSGMVFIEDNVFVSTWNFTVASAIQSYYGARTVVRHNDFTNLVIDQHGTGGNVGARWWEIYENRFFANEPPNICCAMNLRAGSGVIFNNTRISGAAGIDLFEEDSNAPGYPWAFQIGSGINGQTDAHSTCSAASRGLAGVTNQSPAYIWGEGSWTAGSQTSGRVILGRDYFQSANQPSPMFRMEVSGDTCATTYTYVPFTYPHPLQGASALTATIAPSSLTFAGQLVGTTSASQGFSLTNNGSASLTITSIALTGTNSANFSQSNNCGGTLAPGANCTGTVTFTPSATGPRTAAVTFTDNASDSPQALPLSGTGTAPAVTLNPGSLTFAAQDVGTTSPTQPIVLTNSGTAPLGLTSIGLTGTNSGDFAQSNNCPTGATLAVSASCTITVSFSPTLFGSRSASVSIVDSATGSPHTAALTGTARLGIPVGLTVVIH